MKKIIHATSQTEKNLTNITTNPETPNRNKGQIIANEHKIYIIDALTVNQSPMTDNMNAPKSGALRTISPLKKATQFVAASIASLTLAHADITSVATSTTNTNQTSQKVVKVDALADYKIKVDKMTVKELKLVEEQFGKKIDAIVTRKDAEQNEEIKKSLEQEALSLLDYYDIIMDRLEPILEAESKQLDRKSAQLKADNKKLDEENKKLDEEAVRLALTIKEQDEALEALNEVKKMLENPEKLDHQLLIKKLEKALEIHKKCNPELYASSK